MPNYTMQFARLLLTFCLLIATATHGIKLEHSIDGVNFSEIGEIEVDPVCMLVKKRVIIFVLQLACGEAMQAMCRNSFRILVL